MTARAGIVITGTEVLTGRIQDLNGPWLADRLLELGVELAHITICGDRADDVEAQLRFLAAEGVDLIITSGGLGPTADDLTVATVARFCGVELVLDTELEARIAAILRTLMSRRPAADTDFDAVLAANRKQALVPVGAEILEPEGTAPGVVVDGPDDGKPVVIVLPGPPRELQPMWARAIATAAAQRAIAGRTEYRQATMRMFGLAESGLAEVLREAQTRIAGFDGLEITTCLRRGELEIVTRYEPGDDDTYRALVDFLAERYPQELFSADGSLVDEQIAALLTGRTIATAESCTAGMLAARLADRAGSSAYLVGGVVSYSNEAKVEMLGVDATLIATHGAVSEPVAIAMARGALQRFEADTAVGITGIAGPGGGSAEKPVGTVCFSVALAGREPLVRTLRLPGNRSDVRERATTVAMHLLRRELLAYSASA